MGWFSRKQSEASTEAADKAAAAAVPDAASNVANYNMMSAAYNPAQAAMFPSMPMPGMPMPPNGAPLDPAFVANMNMTYQMQMAQMQQQMQQMQALLQAQQQPGAANGTTSSPLPVSTLAPTTPAPSVSQTLPTSTMPALQQYRMAPHQMPTTHVRPPEVNTMQMKALCNNIYSLVKAINTLVEATGALKEEARKLYRLIKRVELLVSDLQPYAMQSTTTLEAVFAVLQDVEAVLLCIKLVFEDCGMKGRLTQFIQADRALEEFTSLTRDLDEAIGQLPVQQLGLADETRHNLNALRKMLQSTQYDLSEPHKGIIKKYRDLCETLKQPVELLRQSQREVMAAMLAAEGGSEDHAAMISDLMRELRTVARDKVHGIQDEYCLRLMVDLLRIANSKSEAPIEFVCPITFQVMVEPVLVVETGYSYEKDAITDWFNKGNKFCPRSGTHLKRLNVVPNQNLRNAISQWRDRITAQLDIAPILTTVLDATTPIEALDLDTPSSELEAPGVVQLQRPLSQRLQYNSKSAAAADNGDSADSDSELPFTGEDLYANATIASAMKRRTAAPAPLAPIKTSTPASPDSIAAAADKSADHSGSVAAPDASKQDAVRAQLAAEMQAQMAAQMALLRQQMEAQMAAQQQAQKALLQELQDLRSTSLPAAMEGSRAGSVSGAAPAAATPAPTTAGRMMSPQTSGVLASGMMQLQGDEEEFEDAQDVGSPASVRRSRVSSSGVVARMAADAEGQA